MRGPLTEVQQRAEDAQGTSNAADSSDMFEDIDLLRPDVRAKIKQLMALNNGRDDDKSESCDTCADGCRLRETRWCRENHRESQCAFCDELCLLHS